MLEILKENIINMSFIYSAFAIVYIANIVLGFLSNVTLKKEDFDFSRLLQSAVKLVISYVGVVAVAVAFVLIDNGIGKVGIDMPDALTETLSILAFMLLFAKAFYTYAAQVYAKLKAIFEISSDIDLTGIEAATKKEVEQAADSGE